MAPMSYFTEVLERGDISIEFHNKQTESIILNVIITGVHPLKILRFNQTVNTPNT